MNSIDETERRDLGIYIHIPFCVKKCDYCDFLSAPATEDAKKEYIDALLTEIESYSGKADEYIVPTIFFGGGTPSCIEPEDIKRIMELLNKVFLIDKGQLEATIEANPGTVDERKLEVYREAGINRISFGLQSADYKELKLLGRIHTYEEFEENYRLARKTGFHNINIDIMSALPGQTLESWENTLNTVIALQPEHISAYSLIIEEGTKFYERYQPNSILYHELPDEETDRLIYHRTKEVLKANGYSRYEISNYAKYGFECRHNSSYWIGTEYLGIGLGASSLLNGARFSNLHNIKQYIYSCSEYNTRRKMPKEKEKKEIFRKNIMEDEIGIRQDYEELSLQQRMEEFMFLGLRMCRGISKNAFFQRFHMDLDSMYGPIIDRQKKDNLITINGDLICLTDYGIDVSNSVLSEFLLD